MILNSPYISGSITVTGNATIQGTISGSVSGTASNATTASYAATASSADNLLVRNTLTAQTLVVQTITSSVDFVTGSTRFGSIAANTHVFTGSVSMNPGGLFVSSSGNVGVGTTIPSSTFHVRGTFGAPLTTGTSLNGIARFGQTSGQGGLDIGFGDPYSWLQSRNATDYSVNYNLVLQPNGGNVGIGTTSPTLALNVIGQIRAGYATNAGITIGLTPVGIPNNDLSAYILWGDNSTFGGENGDLIYIPRTSTTGAHRFYTGAFGAATEKMRITSDGSIYLYKGGNNIFTRSDTTNFTRLFYSSNNLNIFYPGGTSANSGAWGINNYEDTARIFNVRNDGLVAFPKINDFTTGNSPNTWINPSSSYGIYINTSSIRYKRDVINYDKGLDIVAQLRPVYYKGISEVDGDKQFAGLIAEEIDELGLTEFVNYLEDGRPNSLSYPNMITLAFKAIQELKTQNDDLQQQINELKAQ